jgi:hypothetical protein
MADGYDCVAGRGKFAAGRRGERLDVSSTKSFPEAHADDDRPTSVEFGADSCEIGSDGPQGRAVAVLGFDRLRRGEVARRSVVARLVIGPERIDRLTPSLERQISRSQTGPRRTEAIELLASPIQHLLRQVLWHVIMSRTPAMFMRRRYRECDTRAAPALVPNSAQLLAKVNRAYAPRSGLRIAHATCASRRC